MSTVDISVQQIGTPQILWVSDAWSGSTWKMTEKLKQFTLLSDDGEFGHVMIANDAGDFFYDNAVRDETLLKVPGVVLTVIATNPEIWIKLTDLNLNQDNEQTRQVGSAPWQVSVSAKKTSGIGSYAGLVTISVSSKETGPYTDVITCREVSSGQIVKVDNPGLDQTALQKQSPSAP